MPAPLMLIGEAPGAYELRTGRPFVGRSGDLLNEMLSECDLRRASIRIANTCGCVDMEREDRRPLPAELDSCRPRLDMEIALTNPRVILLMGNTAIQRFFPGMRVGQVYNSVRAVGHLDALAEGELLGLTRLLIPTYHPAAVLRNAHLRPVLHEAVTLARRLSERLD